jgi:hypothetical protein
MGGRAKREIPTTAYTDLAKRIEERAYLGSLEAHAYVEHRLRAMPSEIGRHIEERALMASQEAKAYSDSAVERLGMATRAMSKVLLQLSGRMDALQGAGRQAQLEERVTAVERKLALLHDRVLASRASELVAELGELSRRIDDPLVGPDRQQLDRIDVALRSLAADLVEIEAVWTASNDTGEAVAARADTQRQSQT